MNQKSYVVCEWLQLSYRKITTSQGHRQSRNVTYAVKVVISCKRCKQWQQRCYHRLIESDVHGLQNCAIFDNLEWLSRSSTYCRLFKMQFFVQLCSSWQGINWHSVSRGASAAPELLANLPWISSSVGVRYRSELQTSKFSGKSKQTIKCVV